MEFPRRPAIRTGERRTPFQTIILFVRGIISGRRPGISPTARCRASLRRVRLRLYEMEDRRFAILYHTIGILLGIIIGLAFGVLLALAT